MFSRQLRPIFALKINLQTACCQGTHGSIYEGKARKRMSPFEFDVSIPPLATLLVAGHCGPSVVEVRA
jgi:hypothetical protein